MVFGHSFLDPVVVLLGTMFAVYRLVKRPVRLIGFLPAALSLYFFIPFGSLLTLGRIIPMLLTLRLILMPRIRIPRGSGPLLFLIVFSILASAAYSWTFGGNTGRTVFRTLNYVGLLALFLFAFEMGRKPEAYWLLIRGLAATAVIFSVYGIYQVFANYTGLPFRGVVYGPNSEGVFPIINGLPRINSLANEPKRLGFVLFVGALALFELARIEKGARSRRRIVLGVFAVAVSFLTLSTSYLFSIALFGIVAMVLFAKTTIRMFGPLLIAVVLFVGIGSQYGVVEGLRGTVDERLAEVEVGIDGRFVYRQEFYANAYLARHPMAIVTGVGLGRYNEVLNREFGEGVGYTENGAVMQINSSYLELILDIGLPATVAFYLAMGVLVFRLKRAGHNMLAMILMFLLLQSLTIQTVQFCVLVAGVALGQLATGQATTPVRSFGRGAHGSGPFPTTKY